METNNIYLVMRKRYDEGYSKPIAASTDKLKSLAMCMNLTKSKDIFEYSMLEVPLLDDVIDRVGNERR